MVNKISMSPHRTLCEIITKAQTAARGFNIHILAGSGQAVFSPRCEWTARYIVLNETLRTKPFKPDPLLQKHDL